MSRKNRSRAPAGRPRRNQRRTVPATNTISHQVNRSVWADTGGASDAPKVVRGVQIIPVAAEDTTEARYTNIIPSNPAILGNTRLRRFASLYQVYKLRSFAVEWAPSVSVTVAGTVYGGSVASTATVEDFPAALPVANGGFAGAIYSNQRGVVECKRYFDKWRPIFDATGEGNPFDYIVHTPANNLRTDGILRLHYTVEFAEPVVSLTDLPPSGEVKTMDITEGSNGTCELTGVGDAERVAYKLLQNIPNVTLLDKSDGGSYSAADSQTLPAGRVLEARNVLNSDGTVTHSGLWYAGQQLFGFAGKVLAQKLTKQFA